MSEIGNKPKMNQNILKNIRSKYILGKIFEHLEPNLSLNIIRYNKHLQDKLDKSINNYIKNSRIEIELIPLKNGCGKFMNYEKTFPESNYHIFFNDNNVEVKRNNITYNDNVNKITIQIDYDVYSLCGLFKDCECIKKIKFKTFYKKGIVDMSEMFSGCLNLEEIDVSKMITANVTNMRSMFYSCQSLKEINISNFDTNKVLGMSYMFAECNSLKKIDSSYLNTSNVVDMHSMFYNCLSLKELNLSIFNTCNVINMDNMFRGCRALKKLENININKTTSMSCIFKSCSHLEEIHFSDFKVHNIISMNDMFEGCNSLDKIYCSEELKVILLKNYPFVVFG